MNEADNFSNFCQRNPEWVVHFERLFFYVNKSTLHHLIELFSSIEKKVKEKKNINK